jgi:hypothetical protein
MPTAFCSLNEAYGDSWAQNNSQNKTPSAMKPTMKPIIKQNLQFSQEQPKNVVMKDSDSESESVSDQNTAYQKTFCPNCQNCLGANNDFQQKVINQTIWPRPRWEPQYPTAYVQNDPYNRYWTQNLPQNYREEFGNVFENFGSRNNNIDTKTILQIILLILVILFFIQLFQCFYKRTE